MKKQIIALSIISLVGITHQSLAMDEGEPESTDQQRQSSVTAQTMEDQSKSSGNHSSARMLYKGAKGATLAIENTQLTQIIAACRNIPAGNRNAFRIFASKFSL